MNDLIPFNPRAQVRAFEALYSNNPQGLIYEIKKGAKFNLDLYGNSLENRTEKDASQSLGEKAVWRALHGSDLCDCLLEIERHGFNVKTAIKSTITLKNIFESKDKKGRFLEVILDRWPDSLGNWREVLSLHAFAERDQAQKVEVLIRRGFDVEQRDQKGKTPLMVAVGKETVNVILKAGADKTARDRQGKTALWHAMKKIDRSIKTQKVDFEIPENIIGALIRLSEDDGLRNDRFAVQISKRLGHLMDNGLTITFLGGASTQLPTHLKQQVDEVRAIDRMNRLKKSISSLSKSVQKKERSRGIKL